MIIKIKNTAINILSASYMHVIDTGAPDGEGVLQINFIGREPVNIPMLVQEAALAMVDVGTVFAEFVVKVDKYLINTDAIEVMSIEYTTSSSSPIVFLEIYFANNKTLRIPMTEAEAISYIDIVVGSTEGEE